MEIELVKECCQCGGFYTISNIPNMAQALAIANADGLCSDCWITTHAIPAYVKLALDSTDNSVQSFPA